MVGVSEFRRENLALLIEKYGSNVQRVFADRVDLAPAYISQMLTSIRNMGDATARRIETHLSLTPGSIDYPPDYFYAHVNGKLRPGTRIISHSEKVEKFASDTTNTRSAKTSNGFELIRLKINKTALIQDIPLIELEEVVQSGAFFQSKKGVVIEVLQSDIRNAGERVFATPYNETNMNGRIPPGAVLIVDPDKQPAHGDIVLACSAPGVHAQAKRLEIDGPNRYLVNDPDRAEWIRVTDDSQIIGVVLQFSVRLAS